MTRVLRWQTVKTNKNHECPLCRRMIPVGSKMVVGAWADNNSVYSKRFCLPCEQYWYRQLKGEEICFECDSPIYYGDFETWEKIRKDIEEDGA